MTGSGSIFEDLISLGDPSFISTINKQIKNSVLLVWEITFSRGGPTEILIDFCISLFVLHRYMQKNNWNLRCICRFADTALELQDRNSVFPTRVYGGKVLLSRVDVTRWQGMGIQYSMWYYSLPFTLNQSRWLTTSTSAIRVRASRPIIFNNSVVLSFIINYFFAGTRFWRNRESSKRL